MNPEITLRKHQVNAIATSSMAAIPCWPMWWVRVRPSRWWRRLWNPSGWAWCQTLPLSVVPNHLTEQWASEFLQLYPAANVLVATKKDFETKNRKKFCGRIATGDYDAVIIGHSQFEKIPVSIQRQRAILEQQMDEIILASGRQKRTRRRTSPSSRWKRPAKACRISWTS